MCSSDLSISAEEKRKEKTEDSNIKSREIEERKSDRSIEDETEHESKVNSEDVEH